MTRGDFRDFVNEKFGEIIKLLDKKGEEYANSDDAFHNFVEGVDIATSENKECYAWDLRAKHLQSIKDIIRSPKGSHISMINEKCGDDVLYGLIIWAMLTEKNKA